MCSGAMLMSRVRRVCFAVPDPKMGCLGGATNAIIRQFVRRFDGELRDFEKAGVVLAVSNIVIALSQSELAQYAAWFDEFVIRGICDASHERAGSLTFLDASLKNEVMRIDFGGVGITRITRQLRGRRKLGQLAQALTRGGQVPLDGVGVDRRCGWRLLLLRLLLRRRGRGLSRRWRRRRARAARRGWLTARRRRARLCSRGLWSRGRRSRARCRRRRARRCRGSCRARAR